MRARPALLSTILCVSLAACGGSSRASGAPVTPAPSPQAIACGLTVADTARQIAQRVYNEDAASRSERLDVALVLRSPALRDAALARDPAAARAAARALITSGHVARLRLSVGGRVLTDIGDRTTLAPASAVLTDATGAPIGNVVVGIQSGSGFVATLDGLTGGGVSLRAGSRVIAGTSLTGTAPLPARGVVTVAGQPYAVTSFAASAFPTGTVRVTLTHRLSSAARDCGSTPAQTVANVVGHAVSQIYYTESHGAALALQARRVQNDAPLLSAVAAHDPVAIHAAIVGLLNQHIVRVRVVVPGVATVDVGGPYVLGPTTVALRQGGRTIGHAELSIQDDLGLVLLARRLAGVQVVVALPRSVPVTPAEAQLVASSSLRVGGYRVTLHGGAQPTMSTLPGGAPPPLPTQGAVRIRGRPYVVATLTAAAFPSGPLPVWLLVPVPYS